MSDTFVVKWTQGNGYRCGCCRQEWSAEDEFETMDDAVNHAWMLIHARGKRDQWDTDDNSDIKILQVTNEWDESQIKEM